MEKIKILRCPFLLGDPHEKKYIAGDPKTGEKRWFNFYCPISGAYFNLLSDFKYENGCLDGNFVEKCRWFSTRWYELNLDLPLNCPLIDEAEEKCRETGEDCDHYYIDIQFEDIDYRKCSVFSKWIWEKVAKKK
jgi:hypothetical protein